MSRLAPFVLFACIFTSAHLFLMPAVHSDTVSKIYRNNLKNREFGEKASFNSFLERATIAEKQGASEGKNLTIKPTLSKSDSASCFGIKLSWQEELQQIDAELERLEDEQTKLNLAKNRWNDKGMQWQFQQNMTQEAKRAFQKADEADAQMKINQEHIDILKARRQKIVQEHPEANDTQRSS